MHTPIPFIENQPLELQKRRILLIRHGESEAHIGKAASHIEKVGLSPLGKLQANEIACQFSSPPNFIISSPYSRACRTAIPTLKRFPATYYAIWKDVREFTYLGSLDGQYLTKQERSGKVNAYWECCEPEYRDGNGESFSLFMQRTKEVMERLRGRAGFTVVFTHEQFIRMAQVVTSGLMEEVACTPEGRRYLMKQFRQKLLAEPLPYGYIWAMPMPTRMKEEEQGFFQSRELAFVD